MESTRLPMPIQAKRRTALKAALLGAALAGTETPAAFSMSTAPVSKPIAKPTGRRLRVAMLVHPDMIMQDFVGPLTVFTLMGAERYLVWKTMEPVVTETGLPVPPTHTFATCPRDVDVLFVPGGLVGTAACLNDLAVLAWLRETGINAAYVTSVCTGSLLLGAAGLLQGYDATSHWYVTSLLPMFGANVVPKRVVVDRNRITGGGVTAGIDFGLTLAAKIQGEQPAKRIELVLEYDPAPPFDAGSPSKAAKEDIAEVLAFRQPVIDAAASAAKSAAERLRTMPS